MYLPMTADKRMDKTKKVDIQSFFGINRQNKIDDRQMSSMYNMSSDSIPAMAPRKPRLHVCSVNNITAIYKPEYSSSELTAFTGVADGYFYYNGTAITNMKLSNTKKSIADFGGNICIFPDKVYYRYLPDPTTGEIKSEMQKMGKSISLSGARLYSSLNKITGEYTAYIQKNNAGFEDIFSVGDSVIISGCTDKQNNTVVIESRREFAASDSIVSVVINEVTNSKLSLLMHNKNGQFALFNNTTNSSEIKIEVSIPNMNCVCVHNNRLWGTSENGEYIYASKLGDCFNFNSFQGLNDDSWYCEIGTEGNFTGIASYRTAVVAFKQNYIHHVYGDAPSNFSIPKQTFSGSVDGSSIAEIGGILYYMSADGFYEYTGGEPEKISGCIKTLYKSCSAGTDGKRYYACGRKADGTSELLVFDPEYGTWHKEDNTDFVGFIKHNEFLYGATNSDMYKFGNGNEEVSWCVVSKKFTLDDIDFKGVNAVYIRMEAPKNTKVDVYTSCDEQDFMLMGQIEGSGFLTYRVPVRFEKCDSFRIMLDGIGHAVVHDIEIVTYTGGKTNVKHTR